jgi:hydrogenase expression/formation protein HypC
MCLAIPGKLIEITTDPAGVKMGRANFGGIVKQVCLEYTPEVEAGDYVLVHVGFALSKVDENEAARTYQLLEEMKQLGELDVPDVNPFETTDANSARHLERSGAESRESAEQPSNFRPADQRRDSSTSFRSAQNDRGVV